MGLPACPLARLSTCSLVHTSTFFPRPRPPLCSCNVTLGALGEAQALNASSCTITGDTAPGSFGIFVSQGPAVLFTSGIRTFESGERGV